MYELPGLGDVMTALHRTALTDLPLLQRTAAATGILFILFGAVLAAIALKMP